MPNEQTYIEEADVYVCNNCGAFVVSGKSIEHHSTCKPGEAEYWEKFYSKEETAKIK